MTRTRRYGLGLVVAAGVGVGVVALAPSGTRSVFALALLLGFLVQAPLGWMVARAIGTDGLLGLWGMGMLVRLGALVAVGVAGHWAKVPRLESFLIAMVVTMFALLLVEIAALLTTGAE